MAENQFMHSVVALIIGMLIIVIAFLVLGFNEGHFYNQNLVRWLPTTESEDLVVSEDMLVFEEGMVKMLGVPEARTELTVPDYEKKLLFTRSVYEEKIEDKWVMVRTDESWVNFELLNIGVVPNYAIQYFDLEEKYVKETENERQTIYGLDADAPIIVVGAIKDGMITGGDVFVISNKSDSVLESDLKAAMHYNWWLYKLFSVLLLSIGIVTFFFPLLKFLEVFQEMGFVGVLAFIGISIGLAFLLVVIGTLVFVYWFLILLILGFIAYLLIKINIKKKRKPIDLLHD